MIARTPALLTRAELAEELRVSVDTIDRWIRNGMCGVRLNAIHVGGGVRIRRADYQAWQVQVDRRRNL